MIKVEKQKLMYIKSEKMKVKFIFIFLIFFLLKIIICFLLFSFLNFYLYSFDLIQKKIEIPFNSIKKKKNEIERVTKIFERENLVIFGR